MQTETLKVSGMTCGGCVASVTRSLEQVPGVEDVNVSLEAGEARVQYDEGKTSSDQLKSAVKNAGYEVDAINTAQKPQGKGCCCG